MDKRRITITVTILSVLGLAPAGCGETDPGPEQPALSEVRHWTYNIQNVHTAEQGEQLVGAMEHLAIDLGGRESQICVRKANQEIIEERRVATKSLKRYLKTRPKSRVIVETCAESFHIATQALELGHEVRVVPATLVKSLGVGARGIKTDKRDARVLSEVSCRVDLSLQRHGSLSGQRGTPRLAGPTAHASELGAPECSAGSSPVNSVASRSEPRDFKRLFPPTQLAVGDSARGQTKSLDIIEAFRATPTRHHSSWT